MAQRVCRIVSKRLGRTQASDSYAAPSAPRCGWLLHPVASDSPTRRILASSGRWHDRDHDSRPYRAALRLPRRGVRRRFRACGGSCRAPAPRADARLGARAAPHRLPASRSLTTEYRSTCSESSEVKCRVSGMAVDRPPAAGALASDVRMSRCT